MKTIEEYIELSKKMENTSRGGAPSYIFKEDNVVLIEYAIDNKYGIARHMEEDVAIAANKKNSEGVNTPKHIAIARVTEGDYNYCYVLQELAKGKCMVDYKASYGNVQENIEGMKWSSQIPQEHIEKAIKDLMELFNMGLELKPKNFFYDPEYGYTFIDLLGYAEKPKFDSLLEMKRLFELIRQTTAMQYNVSKYDKDATQQDINTFLNYKADLYNKIFIALSKVVPNFAQYKRYILRTLNVDVLLKMYQKGYLKEDLTLTPKEVEEYNMMVADIVRKNIKRLENGNTSYGNIMVNEIRIEMTSTGLTNSWLYHPECKKIDVSNLDEYEKDRTREMVLLNNIYRMFNKKIIELSSTSDNEYIQDAYHSILKKLKNINNNDYGFKM